MILFTHQGRSFLRILEKRNKGNKEYEDKMRRKIEINNVLKVTL